MKADTAASISQPACTVEDSHIRDTVKITVNDAPNVPPTADAGPEQVVAQGSKVTLDATDPLSKETDYKKCAVKVERA